MNLRENGMYGKRKLLELIGYVVVYLKKVDEVNDNFFCVCFIFVSFYVLVD